MLAARNAHKSLLYAAALLDFDVAWLWPESPGQSLCACPVSPVALERALEETRPAAVYVTSPDYLGGACDVAALAAVSHRRGVPLLVDNAHGALWAFRAASTTGRRPGGALHTARASMARMHWEEPSAA